MMSLRHFVACCGLVAVAAPAFAQRPPDAGSLLREIERSTGRTQAAPAPLAPARPSSEGVSLPVQAGETLFVSAFRIQATRFPESQLQALLKDYAGREVTLAQLQAATRRISDYYRQHDYLAYAFLPPQTVVNGIVEIRVVEASLGKVKLDPASKTRLNPSLLLGMVTERAPPRQPLRPTQLDEGVAIVNELPGIGRAQSLLEPGAAPGESDAVLQVTDAPLAQGDFAINNAGTKGTGEWQGFWIASMDSPFGHGEQFQFNGLKSDGSRYLWLAGSHPIGTSGLRVGLNGSAMDYDIGHSINPLDLNGSSWTLGMTLNQPLRRSTNFSLTATAGFDYKKMLDNTDTSTLADREIVVGHIGLSATLRDHWFGGGVSVLDATINVGNLDLHGLPEQYAGDQLTAQTNGSYGRLNLSASREQPISQRVTLLTAVQAQWAPSNLDSSEKFYLGGFSGVHAYPTGEAPGDSGYLINLETRWQVMDDLRLSGFYDLGWIQQHAKPWTNWQSVVGQPNSYFLQGIGVGLLWFPSKLFQAQAMIASVIGDNPGQDTAGHNSDGTDDRLRGWVQVTFHF